MLNSFKKSKNIGLLALMEEKILFYLGLQGKS